MKRILKIFFVCLLFVSIMVSVASTKVSAEWVDHDNDPKTPDIWAL